MGGSHVGVGEIGSMQGVIGWEDRSKATLSRRWVERGRLLRAWLWNKENKNKNNNNSKLDGNSAVHCYKQHTL